MRFTPQSFPFVCPCRWRRQWLPVSWVRTEHLWVIKNSPVARRAVDLFRGPRDIRRRKLRISERSKIKETREEIVLQGNFRGFSIFLPGFLSTFYCYKNLHREIADRGLIEFFLANLNRPLIGLSDRFTQGDFVSFCGEVGKRAFWGGTNTRWVWIIPSIRFAFWSPEIDLAIRLDICRLNGVWGRLKYSSRGGKGGVWSLNVGSFKMPHLAALW